MKKFKIKSLAVALAVGVCITSLAIPASAATSSAGEFGTMSYDILKSGNSIKSYTQISKYYSYTRVFADVTIQLNSTGQTLYNNGNSATGTNYVASPTWINNTGQTLAVFGTHEARGTGSFVKYTSRTF